MREITDENYLEELFVKEVENAGSGGGGDTTALEEKIAQLEQTIKAISPIKHIQRGKITISGTSAGVTLTGFTNLNKMIVLLDGVGYNEANGQQNYGVHVSSLTLTNLTIATSSSHNWATGGYHSYQVIEFN